MDFRIASTFTDALGKLTRDEQKAVKTAVFDLQTNPAAPGLHMHRIEDSRDPHFWSVRVNRDIRIVIHRTGTSFLVAYAGHHDNAYGWARRRRIEAHPRTGAVQIVEVRERAEEVPPPRPVQPGLPLGEDAGEAPRPPASRRSVQEAQPLFARLDPGALLSVGVPEDWIADVLAVASEDAFLELATHLPAEAAEALLEFAATGILKTPAPVAVEDPFAHPDAERRFRVIENVAELEQALAFPWEKWIVFLHPAQRELAGRSFPGPARVAGSAGTGKTVVALHRAARLAAAGENTKVLLATFSEPLARALERKLKILAGEKSAVVPRVRVAPFSGIARELYELVFGRAPALAPREMILDLLKESAKAAGLPNLTSRFLMSEWTHVADAWRIESAGDYGAVPRLGRKNRLGAKQRERLWPVFGSVAETLKAKRLTTEAGVFHALAAHYAGAAEKPFSHIVLDEAQDLGVPELRFFAALAPDGPDGLFFAGDLGQRIFQQPFSWKKLGVDVQGRSFVLKVNYRTSHQIRETASRLLPDTLSDVDGREEERRGAVSVFNGPAPETGLFPSVAGEREAVAAFLRRAVSDGAAPEEIGVFVREREALGRAHEAIRAAGLEAAELTGKAEAGPGAVRITTMHLAKGLEFKAVAVMACDEDLLPLKERVAAVADETELEEVLATERQLLYVACTRARDRLLVTAVKPGSEFIGDLGRAAGLEATLLPPVLRQAVPAHPGASAAPDEGSAPPPDAQSAPHGVTETAEAPIAAG